MELFGLEETLKISFQAGTASTIPRCSRPLLDTQRGAAHSSHFVYFYFYTNIVQLQSHHGMNAAHLSHPSPGAERAGNKRGFGKWFAPGDSVGNRRWFYGPLLVLMFSNCFIGEEMLFKVEICDRAEQWKMQENWKGCLAGMSPSVPRSRVDSPAFQNTGIDSEMHKFVALAEFRCCECHRAASQEFLSMEYVEFLWKCCCAALIPFTLLQDSFLLIPAFMWKTAASETSAQLKILLFGCWQPPANPSSC